MLAAIGAPQGAHTEPGLVKIVNMQGKPFIVGPHQRPELKSKPRTHPNSELPGRRLPRPPSHLGYRAKLSLGVIEHPSSSPPSTTG